MKPSPFLFEVAAGRYLLAPSDTRPDQVQGADGVSPIGPLSHLVIDRQGDDYVVLAVLKQGGRYPVAGGSADTCTLAANKVAATHSVVVKAPVLAAKPIRVNKQYTVIHNVSRGMKQHLLSSQVEIEFRNAQELFEAASGHLMSPPCPIDGGYTGILRAPSEQDGQQIQFSLATRSPEALYAWSLVAARLTLMGEFPSWHMPPAGMCPRCLGRHLLHLDDNTTCQECLYELE